VTFVTTTKELLPKKETSQPNPTSKVKVQPKTVDHRDQVMFFVG
jgi:hypothetical protein